MVREYPERRKSPIVSVWVIRTHWQVRFRLLHPSFGKKRMRTPFTLKGGSICHPKSSVMSAETNLIQAACSRAVQVPSVGGAQLRIKKRTMHRNMRMTDAKQILESISTSSLCFRQHVRNAERNFRRTRLTCQSQIRCVVAVGSKCACTPIQGRRNNTSLRRPFCILIY